MDHLQAIRKMIIHPEYISPMKEELSYDPLDPIHHPLLNEDMAKPSRENSLMVGQIISQTLLNGHRRSPTSETAIGSRFREGAHYAAFWEFLHLFQRGLFQA
jgi:hypothetical protein